MYRSALNNLYTFKLSKYAVHLKYFGSTPNTKCLKCFDVGICLKIQINNLLYSDGCVNIHFPNYVK